MDKVSKHSSTVDNTGANSLENYKYYQPLTLATNESGASETLMYCSFAHSADSWLCSLNESYEQVLHAGGNMTELELNTDSAIAPKNQDHDSSKGEKKSEMDNVLHTGNVEPESQPELHKRITKEEAEKVKAVFASLNLPTPPWKDSQSTNHV